MIPLLEALNESALKKLATVPAVFARGATVINASYADIEDDPLTILDSIRGHALIDTPEDITGSDSSGAGTTTSRSLNTATTGDQSTLAGIHRKAVFAVQVDVWVPRDQVASQITVNLSTFKNLIGQAMEQQVVLQCDPKSAPVGAAIGAQFVVELLFIPGVAHRGRRLYSPAAIGPAQALAGDANAQAIVVAGSGLTNNNVVNVRLVTRGHEDIDRALRFGADSVRNALQCGNCGCGGSKAH